MSDFDNRLQASCQPEPKMNKKIITKKKQLLSATTYAHKLHNK